jgi:putative ATP-dependent endonuclease of OLD family
MEFLIWDALIQPLRVKSLEPEIRVRIARLVINNFRGVRDASIFFPKHAVLIGDNNTGKSTVLEALDLVLGPDRLSRQSPIDEHDFHLGMYRAKDAELDDQPRIMVEAVITGLSEEQRAHFNAHIEWWDNSKSEMYTAPDAQGLDNAPTEPALRVTFVGRYDPTEDDFEGKTYFAAFGDCIVNCHHALRYRCFDFLHTGGSNICSRHYLRSVPAQTIFVRLHCVCLTAPKPCAACANKSRS